MSKTSFRVYKDTDGIKYQFNSKSFKKYIKAKNIKAKEAGKESRLMDIKGNIAKHVGLGYEAVENWYKGTNGPGSLEDVKTCANVLEIDYLNLLIPLNENKEVALLSKKEIELIETIFQKSMEIIYSIPSFYTPEMCDRKYAEIRPLAEGYKKNNHQNVRNLHMYVDKNALNISNEVRYKLHYLLIELDRIVDHDFPYRWEDITDLTLDKHELYFYLTSPTRNHIMKDRGFSYISDEIDIAESLGFDSCVQIPEDEIVDYDLDGQGQRADGSWLTEDEMLEYGFKWDHSDDEWEITPQMIYTDVMTKYLKAVFQHDFPGIKND